MERKSIFNRVLLLMVCIVIIPMLIVYSILSTILIANLQQNHMSEVQSSAYNASQSFKDAFSSVIDVSVHIIGNVYVREFLICAANDHRIFETYKPADSALEKYYIGNNYISCVQVSTIDGRYMLSSGITQPIPFTEDEKNRMLESSGAWFCERNDSGSLVVYRLMNNTENPKQKLGFIKLTVDENMLVRQISASNPSKNNAYVVMDERSGSILISTNSSWDPHVLEIMNDSDAFYRNEKLLISQQHDFFLVQNRLKVNTRLMDFMVVAESKNAFYSVMKYGIILLLLLLFSLFCGLYVTYYRKQIVIPLRQLGEQMSRLNPDETNREPAKIEAKGEILELIDSYNAMSVRLWNLYDINYKNELKLRDANLLVLQSEISPHFLHNVLNSIQWMIELDEKEAASNMIRLLSEMFRLSLTMAENSVITLKQELEHLDKYISLERYRFEEKVHFYINVQEGLEHTEVGKFILQPLLENAIVHGIKKSRGYGNVVVSVYTRDGDLIYDIRDDGAGADAEKVQSILLGNLRKQNSLEGFALENIQTRLKLRCGDDYGITYQPREGGGSIFLVKQPLVFKPDSEVCNEIDDR